MTSSLFYEVIPLFKYSNYLNYSKIFVIRYSNLLKERNIIGIKLTLSRGFIIYSLYIFTCRLDP